MVKFINKLTGNAMWVADDRVDEYKAAGHRLAASESAHKAKPKKANTKKTDKKQR